MTKNQSFSVFFILLVFCVAFSWSAAECVAQSSSRISPWLTMPSPSVRRNDVLDPYNTYIRPQTEMRSQMQGFSSALQTEDTNRRNLEGRMDRMLMQPTKGAKGARPQGGAAYRQYLHYYPQGLPQGGVPYFGRR